MAEKYSVNLWGSHPDNGNDDCHTGADFADLASAQACLEDPSAHFRAVDLHYATHLELCEVSVQNGNEYVDRLQIKQIKTKAQIARLREDDDRAWRREMAMEAGMLGGIDAYNEVMGY